MKIVVGDVVSLKTGGPLMTVYHISVIDPSRLDAQWFEDGVFHDDEFSANTLIAWVPKGSNDNHSE